MRACPNSVHPRRPPFQARLRRSRGCRPRTGTCIDHDAVPPSLGLPGDRSSCRGRPTRHRRFEILRIGQNSSIHRWRLEPVCTGPVPAGGSFQRLYNPRAAARTAETQCAYRARRPARADFGWLAWHGVVVDALSAGELVRLGAVLRTFEDHPSEAATLQPDALWAVIGRQGLGRGWAA